MNRTTLTVTLAVAAAALAGCASKVNLADPAPVVSRDAAPATAAAPAPAAATGNAVAQSGVAAVDLTRSAANAASEPSRFVYFDFDSFAIAPDFKPVVEQHAQRLQAHRDKRIVIAGHADERGGREYNLALGQKRADAVARSIVLMGGDASRLETKSYGEERPKAQGSGEQAWALNRRAELSAR